MGFGVFPLWLKDVEDQKMALSLLMSLSGQDSLILLPGFSATLFWAPWLGFLFGPSCSGPSLLVPPPPLFTQALPLGGGGFSVW